MIWDYMVVLFSVCVRIIIHFNYIQFYRRFGEYPAPIFTVEVSHTRKGEHCVEEKGEIMTEDGIISSETFVTIFQYALFHYPQGQNMNLHRHEQFVIYFIFCLFLSDSITLWFKIILYLFSFLQALLVIFYFQSPRFNCE
jgi:hypothetical protein